MRFRFLWSRPVMEFQAAQTKIRIRQRDLINFLTATKANISSHCNIPVFVFSSIKDSLVLENKAFRFFLSVASLRADAGWFRSDA